MYKRILVAYDRSEGGRAALDEGLALAKTLGSDCVVLWVVPPVPYFFFDIGREIEMQQQREEAFLAEIDKDVKAACRRWGHPAAVARKTGSPAFEIVRFAEEKGFDLIVLGHSAYVGPWGRALGSVAARVSEEAACAVLIARLPKTHGESGRASAEPESRSKSASAD
ncbi:TRAP-T-associated universal stress protein TeaD [Methylacidimicrobium cyclopophantes]|uniref:TRAP-T-associated universal stress protein TeaD n=1 Tax=Methylacidimicrobium cyclopophantes TaxID=1041766 RepID=A0A5E6MC91_9BACT|nr:universal stress protein [Methylacidimicrobium cyclopophantes]VVM05945.1 TRAP-T-associated universal stress protein TeaD [Methylacidimicrobium cyclopophantes]